MSQKKLAILMSALDNTVMTVLSRVLASKCMVVCRGAKKVAVITKWLITEVAIRWGSTVIKKK